MKKNIYLLTFLFGLLFIISCEKSPLEDEEVETHNYLSFYITATISESIQPYDCWVEVHKDGSLISSTITINGWYGTGKVDCEENEEVSVKIYSLNDDSFIMGVDGISPQEDPNWFVETTDLLKTNNSGDLGHFHLGVVDK